MAKKKLTLEDMLVPVDEIPYEVPENWCWTRLEYIGNLITGNTPSKNNKDLYGNDIAFIKPTDLNQGRNLNSSIEYLSTLGGEKARLLPKGSTAVCCIGATIGKVAYLNIKGATNQQINSIVPNKKVINDLFVYYYTLSNQFQSDLIENSSSTTLPIINKSRMGKLLIPLPPLDEQERTVNRIESLFDKIDRAAELVDEARDGFEKRRAAILERGFSGELTKKWREENGISDEWNKVKLSDICDITMGQSPKGSSYNDIGEGTPLVNGPVEFGPTHFSKTRKIKWTTEPTKMCKEGDLLLCVRGSLGKINIAGFEACIGRGVASIRAKEGISQMYVNYKIHSMKNEINSLGTGTTFLNISSKQIKDIEIALPNIEEQRELVKILDKLLDSEHSIEEVSNISNNIEVIKKSILAKAFRGELGSNDLNEDSSIELLKELIK